MRRRDGGEAISVGTVEPDVEPLVASPLPVRDSDALLGAAVAGPIEGPRRKVHRLYRGENVRVKRNAGQELSDARLSGVGQLGEGGC